MKFFNIRLILCLVALQALSCSSQKLPKDLSFKQADTQKLISPNQLIEVNLHLSKSSKDHDSGEISVVTGKLKSGSIISEHSHAKSTEVLIFKRGAGEIIINEKVFQIEDNSTFIIPVNTKYSYSNRTQTHAEFIQIFRPSGPELKYLRWAPNF